MPTPKPKTKRKPAGHKYHDQIHKQLGGHSGTKNGREPKQKHVEDRGDSSADHDNRVREGPADATGQLVHWRCILDRPVRQPAF
jgi:hypothetical protein